MEVNLLKLKVAELEGALQRRDAQTAKKTVAVKTVPAQLSQSDIIQASRTNAVEPLKPPQKGPFHDTSPTCGSISGKSRVDLQNVKRFCSEGIPEQIVVGAYAMEEILWVKVSQTIAQAMLDDTLRAERLIKTWMRGWKKMTGSEVVMIYLEWGDVEIANGQTTAFSGDKVTMRNP